MWREILKLGLDDGVIQWRDNIWFFPALLRYNYKKMYISRLPNVIFTGLQHDGLIYIYIVKWDYFSFEVFNVIQWCSVHLLLDFFWGTWYFWYCYKSTFALDHSPSETSKTLLINSSNLYPISCSTEIIPLLCEQTLHPFKKIL